MPVPGCRFCDVIVSQSALKHKSDVEVEVGCRTAMVGLSTAVRLPT
jgi:hypothetical protein